MAQKKESEKRVVKKQSKNIIRKYSLEELAELFGVSLISMRSLYKIRGLDKDEKLSYEEANQKFNGIM